MFEGYLDGIDSGIVYGWAIDRANPAARVSVSILAGGELLGEVSADQLREDLRSAGIGLGHGRYGFRFKLPHQILRQPELRIRAVAGGVELSGSPMVVQTPTACVQGVLDEVSDGVARGWARLTNAARDTARVRLLCGEETIGESEANLHRADLEAAGIGAGHGCYSFEIPIPVPIRQRRRYTVRALVGDVELNGCPQMIVEPEAAPKVVGFLDGVDAGVASGWALDEEDPGTPVRVRLLHDEEVVAETPASLFRADLRQVGLGQGHGRYGFQFRIPEALRQLGSYSIRTLAGNFELQGSPFRVTEFHTLPPAANFREVREAFASYCCQGHGLEVGALDMPLRTPPGSRVDYVDTLPAAELKRRYADELADPDAVAVDVVSDAHTLEAVEDGSADFLIANQVLEHLENPLLALENFLRVVRRGGYVFLTIPDKRFTFDAGRPVTTFEHLLDDYRQGPERSREEHYREFVELAEKVAEEDRARRVDKLMNELRRPVHFHVWDATAMLELLRRARASIGLEYEIDCFKANLYEVIVVLRKP